MRAKVVLGCLAALLSSAAFGQTPAADLAAPPAGATHFIIESTAGKHGDSWAWVTSDGVRMARETWNLRGQVWDQDMAGRSGPDGMAASMVIRGVTPQGDAAETFTLSGGTATWTSPIDAGHAAYASPAFYIAQGGPIDTNGWFLERLLAAPGKTLALLPGGKAKATRLTSVEVGEGVAKQTVTLWAVSGLSNSPIPIWADARDRFFGTTSVVAWLPEAYAGELAKLEAAQAAAMAAEAPRLFKSLVKVPTGPVAFTHVRMFDAEGRRFLADRTVVVDKGLIVAVGAASSVKPPPDAQVIDGRGKTLVPGLWDCHMHVGDDYTGPLELSLGVTSVRDPGNNDLLTLDRRARAAAGKLLFPHVYPSSLIDGKGPYTAQVANVATSQAEAIALIDRAKANSFTGIKFYGTFNPAWLPAAIAEAHRLGLHVHGHIPAGIRTMEAIDDGYDEVTHINWVMMQALPASLLPVSNGIARFEGPGRYAKDVDLDGPAIRQIVGTMARKHVYSDPTMVAFESLYVPENGDMSPSYAPFIGILPPAIERGFRAGGFAVPKDLTRADYRASWAKMVGLLGKMHQAGVPIVAGTDGSGLELVHELEIYVQAGFTPAEALAAATIAPATLVGQETHTGSIKVGKTADLVLVEGDPSARIGDLRQTRVVMLDGKLLDADALRTAAGFSGRPR
ncbi:amidohydrolase family protein [Phenylobacterium sp.]|uniref:amidohydrolase family protein n=1 Tax=Phenylobacterium sp. TaxID=1871053 RepID=UPI00286BFDCC|nr:amidohydrolase family protein [Phenylobacterium sp.]